MDHGGEIKMVPAINLMPSYCGWLLKKRTPGGIKSNLVPQRRWCCVKQGVFYYYMSDLSDQQQGSFLLDGYIAEQMVVKKSNLWIRLSHPGYRTYEFQASDEADLQKWMDALTREMTQPHAQGSSPTNLARRELPPLPGQMQHPGQMLLPGQMLPPLSPTNQPHFVSEPDTYDDTDIPPTHTDNESEDSYDDVDPASGPPFIPPRPAPLSELKGPHSLPGPPQLPVRPGKEGLDQGNIGKGPPWLNRPNIRKGPALPSKPKPGGKTVPPVLPETERPETPPRRPRRGKVESDIYDPVLATPDSDTDSDSYDDAISEIVRSAHLKAPRTTDSGFSSQASDWSNTSFRSALTLNTDGPTLPPIKKLLPPKPTNPWSRPPQPIPSSGFDLQSQLKKKLHNLDDRERHEDHRRQQQHEGDAEYEEHEEKIILHTSLTFSRRFTTEGGDLKNPSSDVVLNVPAGAVPPGEWWTVCVKVHTDLVDYSEWLEPSEYIMGPVVECTVNSNKQFNKPVTVTIPLCETSANPSDVTVLYSTAAGPFQDVHDYVIRGNLVFINTHHFTKFLVKGRKPLKIKEVLVTLRASMEFSRFRNRVELRLMTHVNCHGMKDFKDIVHQMYDPPGMQEIDKCKVCLPKTTKQLSFPEILMKLEIDHEYRDTWEIMKHGHKAVKEVEGNSVLNIDPGTHNTEYLGKFVLESKNKSEEVSFLMGVTFKYDKSKYNWTEEFLRTYGRGIDCKTVTSSVCSADVGASSSDHQSTDMPVIPNAATCGLYTELTYGEIDKLLTEHKKELLKRFELSTYVRAALRAAEVITAGTEDELAVRGKTPYQRIDIVLETVRRKGVPAFLDFCHVLCQEDIGQQHLVTEVLGLNMADIERQREEPVKQT